jgi:cell division protein FtsZ
MMYQDQDQSVETEDYCVAVPEGDSDEFLSEILANERTRGVCVGIGGAGNNVVSRLAELGTGGITTLAVNTDAQDLFCTNADHKLLIGRYVTLGQGTGNNPEVGRLAAEEDLSRIDGFLRRDIVILFCGLGGGTGTGATPLIAKRAKKHGALVIAYCILPFTMEGELRLKQAREGLAQLATVADSVIPLPNDVLLQSCSNLRLLEGFKMVDELIAQGVRGLVHFLTNCGVVNLDMTDLRNVLSQGGSNRGVVVSATFELPLSDEHEDVICSPDLRVQRTQMLQREIDQLMHHPLSAATPKQITQCLVSISGNHDLTLEEVGTIVERVASCISPESALKFGVHIDPIATQCSVTVVGTQASCPQLDAALQ